MISALALMMMQAAAPAPVPMTSPTAALPPLVTPSAAPPPPSPPGPPPPPRPKEPARARANLGSLISNDDYPAEALRHEEQGVVGFRLTVGTNGMVTACQITSTSGSSALDSTTCRILTERARFSPARDARGRPTIDYVSARIVWRIEQSSDLMPFEPTLIVATTRVSPAGESTCSIAVNGQAKNAVSCPSPQAAMVAAARSSGRALEETFVMTFTPGGEAEPADPGDHGTRTYEGEILLGVAADGSILECGAVTAGERPDACRQYPRGKQIFQAAEGAAARAMRVRFRSYRRF
jgi:TonB family protein